MKLQIAILSVFLVYTGALADGPLEQAEQHFKRGYTYKQNKNPDAAIKCFQQTLALNPRHFEAHFHLACEYYYRGLHNDAIIHYQKAIRINPKSASTLFNLGTILAQKADQKQEAYACFTKALAINPRYTQAYFQRGKLLESLSHIDAATANYRHILEIQNDNIDALAALAKILRDQEQYKEALTILARATELQPKNIHLWFDLAHTANMIGDTQRALKGYDKILIIAPNHAQTYHNMGYTLKMANNPALAITMYQRALELDPSYTNARFALGLSYLNNGQFEQGWAYHEKYLQEKGINGNRLRAWLKNGTVAGKRLLLRQQGGLGDTMQFIRYVQLLKELGAYIIVTVRKPIKKLLSHCPYIDELIVVGQQFPPCDEMTTLMALPAIFNSTEKTIPRNIPYLFADPVLVQQWHEQLTPSTNIRQAVLNGNIDVLHVTNTPTFKIGLCWISDRHNDKSRPPVARRSVPIELLAPLADIENVQFYNVQKISDASEFELCPEGLSITTFGPDFDTTNGAFMDTAALMKNLDLVITVDTSIAHLAGGLGVPVWMMLPYSVDWRWIAKRTDSPWYPTMRIFKQQKPMNWVPVVQDVADALQNLVGY